MKSFAASFYVDPYSVHTATISGKKYPSTALVLGSEEVIFI